MAISLFISPSVMHGNSFSDIMILINKGSIYFGKNDNNSNYSKAIYYYKEAITALKITDTIGDYKFPIKSSDKGYVYDAVLTKYQITVSEKLLYFLNLNIGKSYVGLCQRNKMSELYVDNCEKARTFLIRAKVLLNESIYKNKKYTDVNYHLAFIHLLHKEYNKAKEILIKELAKNPKDARLHATLGIRHGQYVKDRKYAIKEVKQTLEKAKKSFIKALDIDPENHAYLNNLGEIYFMKKEYTKAIKYYDEAIFNNPVDSTLYRNRGLVYFALFNSNRNKKSKEKYAEAICRDFEIAIKINPIPEITRDLDAFKLKGICP
jgi:tetratricopeptide (TPR) repeat protein